MKEKWYKVTPMWVDPKEYTIQAESILDAISEFNRYLKTEKNQYIIGCAMRKKKDWTFTARNKDEPISFYSYKIKRCEPPSED